VRPGPAADWGSVDVPPGEQSDVVGNRCYNSTVRVVRKVCACVVRQGDDGPEVLVFDHPSAGTQLPKGTLEPHEDPADGVLRELAEETGVGSVELVDRFGHWVRIAGAGPDEQGAMQRHEWELFLLRPTAELPTSWTHAAVGSAAEVGKMFRCRWVPVDDSLTTALHPLFTPVLAMLQEVVLSP
jgi:8-oxo-dGTP pyrophosphatase MutT (NUDIX family)